ncbi:beta-ketoacyl-ACP synthase III [Jiulongibacter sp. NS-SX5]|uniref:beta-ketoacyl-ACP synthase III n=1 Tax=Jiulongibacter sp. NS-SX5 TaxID=3463854 RepID=UPI0040590F91
MSINAAITGVNAYLPDDVLTNADLEKIVETNDEWITSRTGIKERRILKNDDLGTSYMAAEAVKGLLKKTNTKPEEVDLVIVATVTPDYFFPSTANLVCTQVGIPTIGSFDILAACSGFIYALSTGSQFIESGKYKKVIVVGADKMSSIIDWKDRTTCILFGDGAGAVMLEPSTDGHGLLDFRMHSDGTGENHLIMKGGGSRFPASHDTVDNRLHYIRQEGQAVFKFAVTKMADTAEDIMTANNLTGDDIAYLVPHQANKRIIDATARRMGVGQDKVMLNINKYGNTTAATIPLCLFDYESKLKKGDNLILAAFGGGFTWGSAYLKWAY